MRIFKEIKKNYYFTKEDEDRLSYLKPTMEKRAEKVVSSLYQWIIHTPEARKVFKDDALIKHVMELIKSWFISLFSGDYGNDFYDRLIRIGQRHEQVGVEPHFMIRAINVVRNSCHDIICEEIESNRDAYMISVDKILDMTLDIILSAYIEEEIKEYSAVYRFRNTLIRFSEMFSQFGSVVLVIILSLLSFGVMYLCVEDILKIFTGNLEQTIVTALGSVLILWVMLELLNTEINHLKGGRFKISLFIGVALVTNIRETMIAILKHDSTEFIAVLIGSILAIGVVYWLVKRSEEERR